MTQATAIHPIRIGVHLHPQHTTYADYADAVRRVDEMGVDSIWNWDHFFPLYGDAQGKHFEGWTLLTAMATLSKQAKIGCLVTCNSSRNPASPISSLVLERLGISQQWRNWCAGGIADDSYPARIS